MNYVGDAINQLIAVQQYKQGQQRQGVLDSQAERRNSLAEQFQRMQIEEMQRAQAQRTATQGAQRGIYENLDYLQGDFPQRSGELISEMGRQYPGADLGGLNSLAQQFRPKAPEIKAFGDVPYLVNEGSVSPAPGFVSDPFKGLTGDAGNLARIEGKIPTKDDLLRFKKAGATNINLPGGEADKALAKSLLSNAPKLQETAQGAVKAAQRIDRTLDLLDKQGNSVTGLSGAIKRTLSPYATAVGLNTAAMDDAQILEALLTEGQGSMRLAVIGPGPVSEYEQKILEKVSGKKIAAAEGIKLLLEHRQNQLYSDIDNYNNNTDALSQFYDRTEVAYPKIKYKKREAKGSDSPPMSGAKQAPDGNWYIQKNGQYYRVEQ